MSYAHTKRRKNIAKFKRQNERCFKKTGMRPLYTWQQCLQNIADGVRKKNDGPLIGSLADIMDAKNHLTPKGTNENETT